MLQRTHKNQTVRIASLATSCFHVHLHHTPPFRHTSALTCGSYPSSPAAFATQPNLSSTAHSSSPPQTLTSHACIVWLAKAPHLAAPYSHPPMTPESAKQAGAARQNPTHSHHLHPGAPTLSSSPSSSSLYSTIVA